MATQFLRLPEPCALLVVRSLPSVGMPMYGKVFGTERFREGEEIITSPVTSTRMSEDSLSAMVVHTRNTRYLAYLAGR